MSNAFFDHLEPETAHTIAQLSRVMYDLRESRKQVLAEYDCADEAELLDAIRFRRIPPHPGYALYLSARILEQAREDARRALTPQPDDGPPNCLHPALLDHVEQRFGQLLAQPVELLRDAIRIVLANGVDVTARFAADAAWSIEWQQAERTGRLDTAPDGTSPHPLASQPGGAEAVLESVLEALLDDPGGLGGTT